MCITCDSGDAVQEYIAVCVPHCTVFLTTQLSNEAIIMSSASEVNVDIKDFLMSINLEQYLLNFQEFGFQTVNDCVSIDDSVLHKIGISPTGHRRRILKQLQMVFAKMQEIPVYANVHKMKNGSTSKEHCNACLSSSQNICVELSDSPDIQTLGLTQSDSDPRNMDENDQGLGNSPSLKSEDKLSLSQPDFPIPHQEVHQNSNSVQESLFARENIKIESLITEKVMDCMMGQQITEKIDSMPERFHKIPGTIPECLPSVDYPTMEVSSGCGTNGLIQKSPFFQFQGEMVVNDLYAPSSPTSTPMRSRSKLVSRPSRSFLLRHRPVPEIPVSTKGSYFRERRNVTTSTGKSETVKNSNEENSSSIIPYGETFLFQRLENSKKRSIKNEFWAHEDTVKGEATTSGNCVLIKSSIYDNRKESTNEDKVEDIWIPREDKNTLPKDSPTESEYSTVEECFQSLRRKNSKASKSRTQKALSLDPFNRHSYPLSVTSGNADSLAISSNAISPYACFYGSSAVKVKSGWLDKLSPQGRCTQKESFLSVPYPLSGLKEITNLKLLQHRELLFLE